MGLQNGQPSPTSYLHSAVGFLPSLGYGLLTYSILQDLSGKSEYCTNLELSWVLLHPLSIQSRAFIFHYSPYQLTLFCTLRRTVTDFEDWTNWLFHKGGIGEEGKKSWEVWWLDEQSHIQTLRGRFWEIVLSLRFFLIQYGVVYALNVVGHDKNFRVSSLFFGQFPLYQSIFVVDHMRRYHVCRTLAYITRIPRSGSNIMLLCCFVIIYVIHMVFAAGLQFWNSFAASGCVMCRCMGSPGACWLALSSHSR
jgi:hypothetical protein